MKSKTNIPALVLAILVFIASNGIAAFEHICNTSQTHSYSLFVQPVCEMEKPIAFCCAKSGLTNKKDCCTHKQFFSKLSIEGFVAKQLQLKSVEKQLILNFLTADVYVYNQQVFENYYSGLSPPDNFYKIKSTLRPTASELQIFRC